MKRLIPIFLALAIITICSKDISAQFKFNKFNSKEMGVQSFDYTATEIKRTDRTSVLQIPGFHTRTAPAARWMMCVYNELAIRRGFAYSVVVYPNLPSEDVLVGFPGSMEEDVAKTLGPEFGGPDAFPIMPVEKMRFFCERMMKNK
jgi:hypothetical protein